MTDGHKSVVLAGQALFVVAWLGSASLACAQTPSPTETPTMSPTPTPRATCAPTGTPYCSDHCGTPPSPAPGCFSPGGGVCIQNPTCAADEACVQNGRSGFCCSCATLTPTLTGTPPTSTPTPTPTGCVDSLQSTDGSQYIRQCCPFCDRTNVCVAAGGGSGCVDVIAPDSCCWSVTSGEVFPLPTITSGQDGCGNGRVCYEVGPVSCYHCTPQYVIHVQDQQFSIGQAWPGTPTPTASATPSPPLTPGPTCNASWCPGDCGLDLAVHVDDILQCVAIALGDAPPDSCFACDANCDGGVTVDEIILAVQAALGGCPPPPPTPTMTAEARH